MDFPNDIETNVHKVTHLSVIYWHLCSPAKAHHHVTQDESDDENQATSNYLHLVSVEYRLRRQKKLVLHEPERTGLWIFSQENESLPNVVEDNGLETKSHGLIRAADLGTASASKPPSAKPPQPPGGLPETSKERVITLTTAYLKFISAITCSLVFSLARHPAWCQLDPTTCINTSSLDHSHLEDEWPDTSADRTSQVSRFGIQWLQSGTLTVSSLVLHIPRMCRLPQALDLVSEVPILLAPFGIVGICAEQPKSNQRIPFIERFRVFVAIWLEKCGVSISSETKWTRVSITDDNFVRSGLENEPESKYVEIQWPSYLCFSANTTTSNVKAEETRESDDEILYDPLSSIEAWYSGKSARAKAVDERSREVEASLNNQKEFNESGDDEAISDVSSPMIAYIHPQDVSGVYPTPPDGLPSQNNEFSTVTDSHGHGEQEAERDANITRLTPYEPNDQGNGDIFDDDDMDIGLTEADFSFFDDPHSGEGEVLREHTVTRESISSKFEGGNNILQTLVSDNEPVRETPTLPVEERIWQAHDPSFYETTHSKEETPVFEAENSTAAISPQATSKYDSDRRRPEVTILHPAQCAAENVDMQGVDLNEKYSANGRFGFDSHELQFLAPKSSPIIAGESKLPEIGMQDGTASNTEDEADQVDSNSDEELSSPGENDQADAQHPLNHQRMNSLESKHGASISTPFLTQSSLDNHAIKPASTSPRLAILFLISAIRKRSDIFKRISPNFPDPPTYQGTSRTFIDVAQVLIDQVVSRVRYHKNSPMSYAEGLENGEQLERRGSSEASTTAIAGLFPYCQRCTLSDYAVLKESPNEHTLAKIKEDSHGNTGGKNGVFKLQAPYTTVQRMGITSDFLISALPFWEELSLGPCSGAKDVTALCIYPSQERLYRPMLSFLDMIKGAYQACNLGLHRAGVVTSPYAEGLVRTPAKQQDNGGYMYDDRKICEELGQVLADLDLQGGNTVIYFVDFSRAGEGLPCICSMFLELFEAYQSGLRKRTLLRPNDLVLQIVPSKLIFSPEKVVIPSPTEYKKLACEVYDRCSPNVKSNLGSSFPFTAAPAIRLSKPIPRTVDLKLISDNTESSALRSDHRLHLAYSWTFGQKWLTASWSDTIGNLQWNSAYWVGKDEGSPWRPFIEAASEICGTTMEMLQSLRRPRQLYIVKAGGMAIKEFHIWSSLSARFREVGLSTTFLSVDPNPALVLAASPTSISNITETPGFLITPGSTPLTNGMSPDVPVHVSTPGGGSAQVGTPVPAAALGDQEAEAKLVDVTDETWGLILDRSIDDPNILSHDCNTKASGYLIKRAGPREDDGLLPMAVQVIHPQNASGSFMKELLGMYRDLATLARIRGVTDPIKGVLPLHVAATEKAHAILSRTMSYEGE